MLGEVNPLCRSLGNFLPVSTVRKSRDKWDCCILVYEAWEAGVACGVVEQAVKIWGLTL